MELVVPVIGILRGISGDFFRSLMPIAFASGLQAVEVTMNTECALDIVFANRPMVPQGKFLGMGTIRNLEEAKLAVGAGAMFLVTPNLDYEVVAYANAEKVPIIVGALTPTEVYSARRAGADMVKVFPCNAMGGVAYIRSLLGPFDDLPLVAVGGVSRENLGEYLAAGARGVGVGSALFGSESLREERTDRLAENIRTFLGS